MTTSRMQSDYCIGIDDEWALDGAERACDTSTFSGCHINHSRGSYNVARRTLRKKRKVQLFAIRDIACVSVHTLEIGAEARRIHGSLTNHSDHNPDLRSDRAHLLQGRRGAVARLRPEVLDRPGGPRAAVTVASELAQL